MMRIAIIVALGACMGLSCASGVRADDPDSPEQLLRAAEFRAYQADLVASLIERGSARDLVLAATASRSLDLSEQVNGLGEGEPLDAAELFRRAAARAGDDALVHWLIAGESSDDGLGLRSSEALQRLEPDNAAVWLYPLRVADKAGDAEATATALQHMAASDHFSSPFSELTLAWLDAFDRLPPPHGENGESPSVTAITVALGYSTAYAFPPFDPLLHVCDEASLAEVPARIDPCLAIGRTMLAKSQDFVSMSLGAALLIRLRAPESADMKRNLVWFRDRYSEIALEQVGTPGGLKRLEDIWRQQRNELAVARRMLVEASIALVPPPGWQPPKR